VSLERLRASLADRYRIERELGQGGMATVYLAEDLKHHRQVAVKVLRPELAATLGPERFTREIEVAARLQHPHILGVLDSGDADGFFYYVMPYVEGETLRDRLARAGELPVPDAVRLLSEIAEALAVAHKAGVVHRDIKPENILLSGRHALVMDFGVAKAVSEASGRQQLTTAGVALGTPAYMAPEQASADPQMDGRLDIYALGVLGYEMLTGHTPFHGLTPQQTLAAHVTQAPAPVGQQRAGLSPALEALVMKCLAKRAADRFQSADELVTALEPLATPSGGMTPTGTMPIAGLQPETKARRWMPAVGGAAVVIVLGGLAWQALRSGGRSRPPVRLGDRTQVTFSGRTSNTVLSSDARTIAYQVRDCAPAGCTYGIEVQEVGGTTTQRVLDGSRSVIQVLAFNPDRRMIAFMGDVGGTRALGLVSLLGGPATRIASEFTNVDFYAADSVVMVEYGANAFAGGAPTGKFSRSIMLAGLDGVVRDSIRVVDSTESLFPWDVMSVPDSPWFIVALRVRDPDTVLFRVVHRDGRRVATDLKRDQAHLLQEWASADALWRLMLVEQGRSALVRTPFDPGTGRLALTGDTLYQGTAQTFSVTRDGGSILISEGSTSYEVGALEVSDLLRGSFPPDRQVATATSMVFGSISPDGRTVLIGRNPGTPRARYAVRPFAGVAETPLPGRAVVWAYLVDSSTVAYWGAKGNGSQLGLLDIRTGATRDTLDLTAPVPTIRTYTSLAPHGWAWVAGNEPLQQQQGGETSPRAVPTPDAITGIQTVAATRDGRQLVVTGPLRAAPDTTALIVMGTEGGAPTTWATATGFYTPIVGGTPVGFILRSPQGAVSLWRMGAPGRSALVGTLPTPGIFGASVSTDLKRAVVNRSEYHGDAWLTRVIRP
jgi:serine/threonine-protein kinase